MKDMADLLLAMSADMGITRHLNESEDSFIYRLCYSALGQWCLHTALDSVDGVAGTTKHNQTIVLNNLMSCFFDLFPLISDRFIDEDNSSIRFPVHIRRIYEETGYLLTNENNRNTLANYGRCIPIGDTALFFGIPSTKYEVKGLGVFSASTPYTVSAKEFLIRDALSSEDFFRSQFDPIDFYDRDIDVTELEFFNPRLLRAPSLSWTNHMHTDCSIARLSDNGPYYRVMRMGSKILFAEEPAEPQSDSLFSYEYRRLYFALKAHYGAPIRATITYIDNEYSVLKLEGHLPNREYYFLLLLSWPLRNAFDKVSFLIHNDLLLGVSAVLSNVGVKVEEEPR